MQVVGETERSPRGVKGERVTDAVRLAIQSGRYVPGQRLVEADLTAELGVSRSLLREAFRLLSAEGLIEIVPNRGALVRRLTRTETFELFQIRIELEALAARLAAENAQDLVVRSTFEKEVAPIWAAEIRLSASAYLSENERFHAAVFSAAGNSALEQLNRQLQLSLIMAQIATSMTPDTIDASIYEHRAIARAILDGDLTAADNAARAHISRARDFVLGMPDQVFRAESA
ncbi:GntR family transcriptional regulator [Nitratireductor sp. GCM10026969]|uniref:GntR family transcriptional regulator n=1 Tax=Nitratireductor sp. GCM10026969 TaxID=3252645 RepID=UPI0036131D45